MNDAKDERRSYWCFYSQILASQSRYVDTLLSTPLPTNNEKNPTNDYKEIVFPGTTFSQWERMMRFLTDPLAHDAIAVEDAMELAPIYDK